MTEQKEYQDMIMRMETEFTDIEDSVVEDLADGNEEFRSLSHESSELDYRHKFIAKVLHSDEGEVHLTEEEHKILREYIEISSMIDRMERKHLYFRGHTDAYVYLKKIGALK